MKIKATSKIQIKRAEYKKYLLTQALDNVNSVFLSKYNDIKQLCKDIVKEIVLECHEMESLKSGNDLAKQMGISPAIAPSIINAIAERTAESMYFNYKAFKVGSGNKILGRLRIGIIKADYSDVLKLDEAEYVSVNKAGNSTPIPWLEWLLLGGSQILVKGYRISLGSYKGSRSGGAIMLKIKKPNAISTWRVPAEFSGTDDDNFLTRAFEKRNDEFIDRVQIYLKSLFS